MDKYFVASIAAAKDLGNKRIQHLLEVFGSGREIWSANVTELKQAGLPRNALESLLEFRQTHPDAPAQLADYCQRNGFGLCSFADEDYPPILKEISVPPMIFYYRGQLQPDVERVGIVGTRDNTPYGQNVARELGRQLAAAGLTVVSGAARGIDSFAHRGALETGRTVAVLGQGLSVRCSRDKKKLLDQITERGLVMSEFSLKTEPNEGTFVTRNRIIAGLCRGVVVVEAGEKSGALNTGTWAVENSREVFCIPGNVYSEKSVGCHNLIREGATLIKNANDVLEFYNLDAASQKDSAPTVELSDKAAKILELIPKGDFITDDEILEMADDVEPYELPEIIIELDMKGCIVEDAGRYARKFGG